MSKETVTTTNPQVHPELLDAMWQRWQALSDFTHILRGGGKVDADAIAGVLDALLQPMHDALFNEFASAPVDTAQQEPHAQQ